jgi:hypothetical protein
MTVTVNIHHVEPAEVAGTRIVVVKLGDGRRNTVTAFFDNASAAADWLRDALDKVEVLKTETANEQPARVATCGAADTHGHVCDRAKGHDGTHSGRCSISGTHATWAQADQDEIDADRNEQVILDEADQL